MKSAIAMLIFAVSSSAFAAIPKPVAKAIADLKSASVRTVVTAAKGNNPCELDYLVDLQVKMAAYDRIKNETIYNWETVKTITVDKEGRVMEVCAE